MLRLFVPTVAEHEGEIRIVGDELRHLLTLRLGPGDRLCLFDDGGAEHEVVLTGVTRREARGRIARTSRASRESALELVLLVALLKQAKMDWVVEKATELGVARIVPVVSRYVVGQGARVERWRRIALSATKQCGRTRVPQVDVPAPLAAALAEPWPGLRLLAWEDEVAVRPRDLPDGASAVTVAVGPEGGFHPDEVAAARAAGFVTVTFGPRVLRAETAAVAAVALCQSRWGDG